MAFEKQNLNYAKEYSQALAQAYPYTLYFGALFVRDKKISLGSIIFF